MPGLSISWVVADHLGQKRMKTARDDGQTQQADRTSAPDTAAQAMKQIALGLGRYRVMSEHEHRLEWEREYRSHP